MTDRNQFEAPAELPGDCTMCEALLPEAVDGTLSAAEQTRFDRHVAHCAACAQEMESAQRGAAWLGMLKQHAPEPPAALLQKILAQTTGAQASALPVLPAAAALPSPLPPARPGFWLGLQQRVADVVRVDNGHTNFQPRFAMTAAMAFFSLALSLNLAGVRLRDLRADDFSPMGVRRVVADAGATAERKFQNLRVVYQLESRVEELRNDDTGAGSLDSLPLAPALAPAQNPGQTPGQPARQPATAPEKSTGPHGSSRLNLPADSAPAASVLEAGL